MATLFSPPPLAEQVMLAVDAVSTNVGPTSVQQVADFCDISADQAESSLLLAVDIGLLRIDANGEYLVHSPLCRFIASPDQLQKAAILRILLEGYRPFIVFRDRMRSTGVSSEAARQTKATIGLPEHYSDIGTALISLGTYGQVFSTEGGGRYEIKGGSIGNLLEAISRGSVQVADAEERIRIQLGQEAVDRSSYNEVIVPLASALCRAIENDPRGAVLEAGNAIDTFLSEFGQRVGANLAHCHGINAKIDAIKRHDISKMPTKIANTGKYLGHLRNGADHGNDNEVNDSWTFRDDTGREYVFVSCSFIQSAVAREVGNRPIL